MNSKPNCNRGLFSTFKLNLIILIRVSAQERPSMMFFQPVWRVRCVATSNRRVQNTQMTSRSPSPSTRAPLRSCRVTTYRSRITRLACSTTFPWDWLTHSSVCLKLNGEWTTWNLRQTGVSSGSSTLTSLGDCPISLAVFRRFRWSVTAHWFWAMCPAPWRHLKLAGRKWRPP